MEIPRNVDRMEPYFQKLNANKITPNIVEVKKNNNILRMIEIALVKEMKNTDRIFKELYYTSYYVGSFYGNMKVGEPDEYDINLAMKLPFDSDIIIDTSESEPGHARIKLNTPLRYHQHVPEEAKRKINLWLDGGYIRRDRVLSWLQGIMYKALHIFDPDIMVRLKISGPAVTLIVKCAGKMLSVDFVPVFTPGHKRWPKSPVRQPNEIPGVFNLNDNLYWCLVPKAPKGTELALEWRMSFSSFEMVMINGLYNMKPVIKFLKFLRDKQDRPSLASYYIYNLFMWEHEKMIHNPKFWRNSLSSLFMHMLNRLVKCLEKGKIKFFWDERVNLISHIGVAERENICGRLKRCREKIIRALQSPNEADLAMAMDILFTTPGRIQMESAVQNYYLEEDRWENSSEKDDMTDSPWERSYQSGSWNMQDIRPMQQATPFWKNVIAGIGAIGVAAVFAIGAILLNRNN